jgi:phosphopantetheine adenylyltransferase
MIALYPGAFKPPHRGHFEVVKSLLNGNHGGKVYDIDSYASAGSSVLKGESDELKSINKVVIFISGGVRNGISLEESMKVWNIYSKYLGDIEIVDGGSNPMITAKDYAKANQEKNFYAITGIRSEEDLVDLKRVTTFKNRENVEGLVIPASPNANVRATDFRKALLSGNLDQVTDFFPKEVSREDILKIMKMLKSSIIAEEMENKLNKKLNDIFKKNEGSSGTHIAHKSVQRSEDRANLVSLYNKLRHDLGDDLFHINFNQDNITITNKGEDYRINFDYTPYMGSILEYMIDEGIKILPLPEIKIKKDIKESSDFFGKTAYYTPETKEVVLYVEGRHPKDVMRSFVHEMIHHKQNLEGRLSNIKTTNTNEDKRLLELEKEAYLEGNITFRNWEDSVKN